MEFSIAFIAELTYTYTYFKTKQDKLFTQYLNRFKQAFITR